MKIMAGRGTRGEPSVLEKLNAGGAPLARVQWVGCAIQRPHHVPDDRPWTSWRRISRPASSPFSAAG